VSAPNADSALSGVASFALPDSHETGGSVRVPVQRLVPAGQTLGVTEQLPLDERHLYSEDYLAGSLGVWLSPACGPGGGVPG
jgi:hypothetical protein